MRFELTDGCPSAVFKTAGLNHSPTSPNRACKLPPQGSNLDFPDPESGVLPITPGGNHPSFQRSGRRGSNPRPSAWEADALPTELLPQGPPKIIRRPLSDQSHRSDLNRRPLDYESSALPLSYGGGSVYPSGAEGNRTPDLCSAIAALSQLSYGPVFKPGMGGTRLELVASTMSTWRSNQLS